MTKEIEPLAPIHLHLELVSDYMSDEEEVMLKRYGESSTGTIISRDILVPFDMTLHALHYTIQKLFGWQNSHLRRFILSEGEHDLFWDDDYDSGNFNAWLRKKYTGPYYFRGQLEHYEQAREDIETLQNYQA